MAQLTKIFSFKLTKNEKNLTYSIESTFANKVIIKGVVAKNKIRSVGDDQLKWSHDWSSTNIDYTVMTETDSQETAWVSDLSLNGPVAYHDMVGKMMNTLWAINPENGYEFHHPISAQELERLQVFTKRLCDSLVQHSDHDEYVAPKLKHLLSQDSTSTFWKIVKNAKAQETGVLLEDLLSRSDLANEKVLDYLLRKTSPINGVEENWYPIVSAKKSVIYPGQTYTAEIFLGRYSKSKNNYGRNVTIKVDGKPFSIIDGLAHFSKRYTTPGEKKYKVEIELKHPMAKEGTILSKEFALLVVDSCR